MTPSNADSTGCTTHLTRTAGRSTDGAMAAMWAGLLLTVVATLAPYVDRVSGHVLADHIRDGYPRYGPERVGHAVTAWLVLLTAAGVLGILGWAGSMWAVRVDMAWARWTATSMFVAGTAVALTALLTKDTSGEVGLAPLLGWLGMLPSGAGLVTVGLLWRTPSRSGTQT